jgi:hypothetical protein
MLTSVVPTIDYIFPLSLNMYLIEQNISCPEMATL